MSRSDSSEITNIKKIYIWLVISFTLCLVRLEELRRKFGEGGGRKLPFKISLNFFQIKIVRANTRPPRMSEVYNMFSTACPLELIRWW